VNIKGVQMLTILRYDHLKIDVAKLLH